MNELIIFYDSPTSKFCAMNNNVSRKGVVLSLGLDISLCAANEMNNRKGR